MTDAITTTEHEGQSLLARICTEVVRTLKDSFGKGPLRAKSYLLDDFLLVVMRGGVTVAEQTMLDRGHSDLVREFRQTYQSQILFEPHIVVEMFFFDDTADEAQIRETAAGLMGDPSLGESTASVTNP